MKRVGVVRFRRQCLSILRELDPDGIVITKHGKPVARLLPIERTSAELIGSLRGRIEIWGDLEATGIEWEAGG